MAQIADARIAIRISRAQKKVLQEKARRDGRSLSNFVVHKLTDEEPTSERPVHSKKAVNH